MYNVKNILDRNINKRVKVEKTNGEKMSGIVDQVSDDYVLFTVNGISKQLHIGEIKGVLPNDKVHK